MRNKLIIILAFVLQQFVISAQSELGKILLKYPFIDTAHSHLQFYGSSQGMEDFFTKLDRAIFLGEGKVNVVHMGGSHVQGGTLSHTLRKNMAVLAPELGVERGFFFPHKLANTNMPGNLYVKKIGNWEGCRNSILRNDCPWGISGIDAITYDENAGWVMQSFSDGSTTYSFTELRIFEHVQTNTMVPVASPAPDSVAIDLEAGVRRLFYHQPIDSVAIHFEHNDTLDPQYTLQGVQMVREESALVYHAIGVNGASTESFLRSENFIEQGRYLSPDLVIFGLGINDAYKPDSEWDPQAYKERYDTLVMMFRKMNPACQFIFMTNNDSYYKRRSANKHALDVVEVMKGLSKEHNAAMWDLFSTMGGLNSILLWEENGLAKSDKIHFTRAGYELNADLMFWAFWEAYEKHLKSLPTW
ncbi:MAG: hypothetical protein RL754_301 [Bacteroidota bacterium]